MTTGQQSPDASSRTAPRRSPQPAKIRPSTRKALLIVHVITSVSLLGHVFVVLTLTLAARYTEDAGLARAAFRLEQLTVHALGIPLALLALLTGVTLALVTPWGLFRHVWVVAKLVLLLATIAGGIAAVRPWVQHLVEITSAGTPTGMQLGGTPWLLLGVGLAQAAALIVATALSISKPKGRIARRAGRAGVY